MSDSGQAAGRARLGLALSGGGHRAACWAAGAVLGVVDAGVADDVVSIASVSGGSIANGVIASGGDLRSADRAEVESWLKPGLRQWAHIGLFFPGRATDSWVASTLGLAAAAVAGLVAALVATVAGSRGWAPETIAWLALVVVVVMALAASMLAWRMLPATSMTVAVLAGAVTVWPFSFAAVSATSASSWWLLVVWPLSVLLLWVAARRFGKRSETVVDALGQTLFPGPLSLGALSDRSVHHVFCATNLRTGNNLYLSNKLTWGHPTIAEPPGTVTLATAVQASACLPGAFLARTINVLPGDPAGVVVLSDGGAYDNMADQWEWGFENRKQYADKLRDGAALLQSAQEAAATCLVVVNASRGMAGTSDLTIEPGLGGEFASALGAKDVLYDVSTATRRRLLIDMFDRAHADPTVNPGGMLVHIGTSPYQVIDRFRHEAGPTRDRAGEALEVLDRLTDLEMAAGEADTDARREHWRAIADANSTVKTTLAPLESITPGAAAALLHHAWVLTRIAGYVLHGWGQLPGRDLDDWRRDRFDRLVAASRADDT
jgi:predicted acylesterase/phospholipase RssA